MSRNTLWMVLGLATRLVGQVLYFILLARSLGAGAFGVFAGTLSLVTFISPFVTWGSGNILIMNVARDHSRFPEYWGSALATTWLSAAGLTFLSSAVGLFLLPPGQPPIILLFLCIGDYFGLRLNELAAQAFQAVERLQLSSFLYISLTVLRLLAAVWFSVGPSQRTVEAWAAMHMASGLLAGLVGYGLVRLRIGRGRISLRPMQGNWREGFFFSVGLSSQGIYNDIDKTILLRISGDAIAGAYAAAYRFLDAAFVPVRALISATYPRFFQRGAGGMKESLLYALRVLPWAGAIALACALGLLLIRPLIPSLLGQEYALSLAILPWLAAIPVFRAFHYLAADSLTGAGFQPIRAGVQVGIAVLNLGLNLWLIPLYGWLGAAWSSLASNGLMAVILWMLASIKARSQVAQRIP